MSDRIAVMRDGRFEQIGTPDEIYNHPKTSYVATFVGNANILKGTAETTEGEYFRASVAGASLLVRREGQKVAVGEPVTVAVRSENIHLDEDPARGLEAEVQEKSFAGGMLRVVLKLKDGTEIIASRHGIDANVEPGQTVGCSFAPEDGILVDREEKDA